MKEEDILKIIEKAADHLQIAQMPGEGKMYGTKAFYIKGYKEMMAEISEKLKILFDENDLAK